MIVKAAWRKQKRKLTNEVNGTCSNFSNLYTHTYQFSSKNNNLNTVMPTTEITYRTVKEKKLRLKGGLSCRTDKN